MSKRSTARTALFASVVVLVLGVSIPLLMEAAIRVVRPQAKSWLDIHGLHPGGLPFHHNRPSFRDSVDVGEVQYTVVTDARGHRIAERSTRVDEGAKSVWFVGDSFTFGQGSTFEDSFVGKVAAAGFRVDDCGVNAWGPAQYLADFEYNLKAQKPPDAIVLATYLGNDYFDMIWSKVPVVRDGVLGNEGDLKATVKLHSHLYRLLSNIYHSYFPAPRQYQEVIDQMAAADNWNAPDLKRASDLYQTALRSFAARCQQLGIPLLVLVIPTKESVAAGGAPAALDHGLVTRRTLEFLEASHIDHVDLTPLLRQLGADASYLAFDGHFKPAAHALVGRVVRDWLAEGPRER